MDNKSLCLFPNPRTKFCESSSQPSKTVSLQNQLQDEALFYYFDAFLSSVEPMSYKEALTESSWIEVMQEELNEFECLEVWELEEGIDFKESFAPISQLVDPENPNHVYKLKKSLYGLKQAPQAWYDLLSSFLLSQNFSKGTVHPTLFIRIEGKDILLDSCIALTDFAESDYAGCQDTRKSTSGSMQLLGDRLSMSSETLQILADEEEE
ncbi:retrovirus-related pol polyprotein from transposon TNT 1-94 [Tanacetum coccineum]